MAGGFSGGWPVAGGGAREENEEGEDLDSIKKQLAELQDKLSKLS